MNDLVTLMLEDAVDCEMAFAEDVLSEGIAGLTMKDMRSYLEFVADQRLAGLVYKQVEVRSELKNVTEYGWIPIQFQTVMTQVQ